LWLQVGLPITIQMVIDGYTYDIVEIFDITGNTWATGNSLPHNLAYAATVDHEESFMVYGGFPRVDKIYKYNNDRGLWDEVDTTMSEKKNSVTAIKVKKSLFNQC